MKKNRIAIIIVLILSVIIAILAVKYNRNSTLDSGTSVFAIADTGSVTRIFLSDKNNNSVVLKKIPDSCWTVNDTFRASRESVIMLLTTMMGIEVREPVSKSSRNTIIKQMAAGAVKVEVYQKVYRIDFLGIRWFPHEKLTKTYYVGSPTQDNMGTYMLMEDADEPFVTYIPGFRGFLSSRYSTLVKHWRDHTVFHLRYNDIKQIEVISRIDSLASFVSVKKSPREFSVSSLHSGQPVSGIELVKMMDLFAAFGNIRYEALLNDMDPLVRDTALNPGPTWIVTVTLTDGRSETVKMFRRRGAPGEIDISGKPVIWDRDRLYALINNDKDLVLIQYYVFDPLIRPLQYYLSGQGSGPEAGQASPAAK